MPISDGYVCCPTCLPHRVKLLRISSDTTARNLRLYCRHCKTEYIVDIVTGQCFKSQSR